MKIICLIISLTLSYGACAGLIGGGLNPLGGAGPDMARTGQTLNQVDQQTDGHLTRDQQAQSQEVKPSYTESYNDDSHREYVRKQKAKKRKEKKEF